MPSLLEALGINKIHISFAYICVCVCIKICVGVYMQKNWHQTFHRSYWMLEDEAMLIEF